VNEHEHLARIVASITERPDAPGATFGPPAEVHALARSLVYHRVESASRLDGVAPRSLPPSLFAGAAGLPTALCFVLAARGESVDIAVGASREHSARLCAGLGAQLGAGMALWRPDAHARAFARSHAGCLHGIPRIDGEAGFADVLLDASRDLTWVVLATPEPETACATRRIQLEAVAQDLDRAWLRIGAQAEIHRAARRARDVADALLARLQRGADGWLWRVSMVVLGDDPAAVRHGLALAAGALHDPAPEALLPVRGYSCTPGTSNLRVHANLLDTAEAAAACALPARERVGYRLRDRVDFAVDLRDEPEGIEIGALMDGARITTIPLRLSRASLARHVLVAGQTGSGKSTTTRALIADLAARGVPSLVLEPAKSEYASLARTITGYRGFQVGSLPTGDELPFRLNPLAFPEGYPLHTHLDHVRQLFVASFGMAPPTPYLLERALSLAYERRGWDLATGEHPNGCDALSFPTLSELRACVEGALAEAGYDRDVERNIRAALRTRLGSLCHGPKGFALDTRDETPTEVLFGAPAVLSLRHLGSDDEKALVMGIVTMRLHELRELQGPTDALRHVLIIEEAHRLLRDVAERGSEEGNMAFNAVQSLANAVAEMRAAGQGVVVVDQLPSRLAPEVVKQVGTRVVHQLPPRSDRDIVADAMVLDEAQREAIATLAIGEAVVQGGSADRAVRARMRGEVRAVRWTREAGADAEQLRRLHEGVTAYRMATSVARAEVTRGAESVLLAAAVALPQDDARRALARAVGRDAEALAALRDAVLRRALHHQWRHRVFEDIAARCGDADALSAALRGAQARSRSRCACAREGCGLAHEAAWVAAQGDAARALARAAREEPARRGATMRASVEARYLVEGPLALDLVRCATAATLASMAVDGATRERVMASLAAE
jgi:hypothetical protein